MNGWDELAKAAALAEEDDIMETLRLLAPRIHALPYRRNAETPGHRVRSICYRLWAESLQNVEEYIEKKRKELRK